MKEGRPFAKGFSLKNSVDSYLCFRLVLLHSVSYFFFLYSYSGGTNRPSELSYNFSILSDFTKVLFTQMVNFPTWTPDCDSHSPPLLDYFLSSDASICSTMAFSLLGNSDHAVVSVFIDSFGLLSFF